MKYHIDKISMGIVLFVVIAIVCKTLNVEFLINVTWWWIVVPVVVIIIFWYGMATIGFKE